jgi:hypothetical protein
MKFVGTVPFASLSPGRHPPPPTPTSVPAAALLQFAIDLPSIYQAGPTEQALTPKYPVRKVS